MCLTPAGLAMPHTVEPLEEEFFIQVIRDEMVLSSSLGDVVLGALCNVPPFLVAMAPGAAHVGVRVRVGGWSKWWGLPTALVPVATGGAGSG